MLYLLFFPLFLFGIHADLGTWLYSRPLTHFTSHWLIFDAKTVLLNLLEAYDVQNGNLLSISCV